MDFVQLAASFGAEVEWSDAGKVRAPQRFIVRRAAEIHVYPELEEGECVAALFQLDRPGQGALPRVTLRPEGAIDRSGKLLGVNHEVQLGDPAFDEAVYVDSDAPDAALRHMFAAPAARAAAAVLLGETCSEVILAGERLTARIPEALLADPHRPAVLTALDELTRLRDAVATPGEPAAPPPARPVRHILVMAAVWLVLAGAAILLRPPPTLAWGPVWSALAIGLGLWLLACVALGWSLRGGADSMRWLLVGGGFYLLVTPFAGMKLALLANAHLDESTPSPAIHTIEPLERSDGPIIKIVAVDLEPGDPTTHLSLPAARVDPDVAAGATRITLHTRPGAFGWRWLERASP